MRKAIRYRLFGMGKMPDVLKAAAAGSDVLLADEGLPVHNHVRSLRIPQARVSSGVRTASGALVMLPDRMLASIGTRVILDTRFHGSDGKQQLALAEDGVRISFDVATVLSGGSGSVDVHYRLPIDASVLAMLPALTCQVALSHAAEAFLYPWQGTYGGGSKKAPA